MTAPRIPRALRDVLFSMLLGFHNAWAYDDAGLDDLLHNHRLAYRFPGEYPLDRPEPRFFWGESSLAN